MASLKEQLDAAGYDTSTLDEGAVLKQLGDAGYDTSSFTATSPSLMSKLKDVGSSIVNASGKVGNMVKAGAAGIGDIDASLIPKAANAVLGTNFNAPALPGAIQQAGQDVQNVEAGKSAETAAGKAGSTVGSFFTPNQIAAQAAGGAVAGPIASGLGNLASKVAGPVITGLTKGVSELPLGGLVSSLIPSALKESPEAFTALVDNPESVSAAQDAKSMAEDTGTYLKGIAKKGMAAAKGATDALSDETPVPGAVEAVQSGIAKLVGADANAPGITDTLNDIIKSLGKDPSEANVHDAIEKLDEVTKFNTQNPTDASKLVKSVRGDLSDLLKAQNPAYKTGMEASAATREPLKTLSQNLGVKNGLPNDWTIKALSKLNNPDALATQRALNVLPGGSQLAGNAANTVAKNSLQQSLLGNAALYTIPKAGAATSGAIQAVPAAGNAVYQGLTQ